jgi:hypothetical protein
LEETPVRGGGVNPLLPFCFLSIDLCFLSAQPRHRAILLCNAGEPLASPEVDDDGAPLDLDPTVAYRFGVIKQD